MFIAAHGGLAQWRRTTAISLQLSSGGLAFATKGQRTALQNLCATVATTGQVVDLHAPGWSYRFEHVIPKARGLVWSTADVAAFAACALWTYVSMPFVLPELDVEEHENRLVVEFPAWLRTHSPKQVLHIDDNGLIRQHDYTALDFGRWAQASQAMSHYQEVDGLMIATRRRVRPRMWPHRPLLVWINVKSASTVQPASEPPTHA